MHRNRRGPIQERNQEDETKEYTSPHLLLVAFNSQCNDPGCRQEHNCPQRSERRENNDQRLVVILWCHDGGNICSYWLSQSFAILGVYFL